MTQGGLLTPREETGGNNNIRWQEDFRLMKKKHLLSLSLSCLTEMWATNQHWFWRPFNLNNKSRVKWSDATLFESQISTIKVTLTEIWFLQKPPSFVKAINNKTSIRISTSLVNSIGCLLRLVTASTLSLICLICVSLVSHLKWKGCLLNKEASY